MISDQEETSPSMTHETWGSPKPSTAGTAVTVTPPFENGSSSSNARTVGCDFVTDLPVAHDPARRGKAPSEGHRIVAVRVEMSEQG